MADMEEEKMSEPMVEDLYSCPQYYDIAFSFRGIPGEVDFYEDCIRRYSLIPVRKVLELASGHSPHMGEFACRGYRYTGMDINQAMLRYATDSAARQGITANFVNGDMNAFSLPTAVDFVYVTLGSFYVRPSYAEPMCQPETYELCLRNDRWRSESWLSGRQNTDRAKA